jgi:hypothetical protein
MAEYITYLFLSSFPEMPVKLFHILLHRPGSADSVLGLGLFKMIYPGDLGLL